MFIRMFLYADDDIQSLKKSNLLLTKLSKFILSIEVLDNVRYWKVKGIYVIELNIEMVESAMNKQRFLQFLKSLSDKWQVYGEPVEEILISRSLEGYTYIHEDVEMINIIFNKD